MFSDLFLYALTPQGSVIKKAVLGYHYVWQVDSVEVSLVALIELAYEAGDPFFFSEAAINYSRDKVDLKAMNGPHLLIFTNGKVLNVAGPHDRFLTVSEISHHL